MTRRSWQIEYDCWECGACCRAVNCSFLEGNLCSIYPIRPDICRVGYSYNPAEMSVGEYLALTREACKTLEGQYAVEIRVREENHFGQHPQGNEGGQVPTPGGCNRIVQGGQIQAQGDQMTSGYRFSSASWGRLQTCHPDLQLLMKTALGDPDCPCDFTVTEGHRTEERQNQLYAEGRSQLQWPNSRHNKQPSMAVDVSPWIGGTLSWDLDDYEPLGAHIRSTWNRLELEGRLSGQYNLTWGREWKTLVDAPHWQLDLK